MDSQLLLYTSAWCSEDSLWGGLVGEPAMVGAALEILGVLMRPTIVGFTPIASAPRGLTVEA
jgi:hypothetical protein